MVKRSINLVKRSTQDFPIMPDQQCGLKGQADNQKDTLCLWVCDERDVEGQ